MKPKPRQHPRTCARVVATAPMLPRTDRLSLCFNTIRPSGRRAELWRLALIQHVLNSAATVLRQAQLVAYVVKELPGTRRIALHTYACRVVDLLRGVLIAH